MTADEMERWLSRRWSLDERTSGCPRVVPNVTRADLGPVFRDAGFVRGAEIGVERGVFSEQLLKPNPALTLLAVDRWQAYTGYREHVSDGHYERLFGEAQERLAPYRVEFLRMDSLEAARQVEDASLDFVYLDGNHDLPHVIADLAAWVPKVRAGGVIAGHDFTRLKVGKTRPEAIHVIEAVTAWTKAYRVSSWFVLGSAEPTAWERADKSRSWMWVQRG